MENCNARQAKRNTRTQTHYYLPQVHENVHPLTHTRANSRVTPLFVFVSHVVSPAFVFFRLDPTLLIFV